MSFSTLVSASPFLLTFAIVSAISVRHIFPLLSGPPTKPEDEHYLPHDAPEALKEAEARHRSWPLRRKIAAATFGGTVALATVLAELILCEISDWGSTNARRAALGVTVPTLLVLLVIWIPWLELQSMVRSAGWEFVDTRRGKLSVPAIILQSIGYLGWLVAFWWLGNIAGTPRSSLSEDATQTFKDAALSRVGVIGISLMALLAGFASVSSPWQSFGKQHKAVSENDIERKQEGLNATNDMLAEKRARLRFLESKSGEKTTAGLMGKVMGTIRGDPVAQEIRGLQTEITGLETMSTTLTSNLDMLRARRNSQVLATTTLGRMLIVPSYAFSLYCCYRIFSTLFTTFYRYILASSPQSYTQSTTDPVTRFLGLIAMYYDPSLDTSAWSRTISFLLSGVMLTLSFNAALQTLHLFSRLAPGLVRQARQNLPLVVAQVVATYVISSALLLRSSLPGDVGKGVGNALGNSLGRGVEGSAMERWFEMWFLIGAVGTGLGIYVGRKLGEESGAEWDEDVELGVGVKRS